MELELKIVADNPRELIKIAAKLSDLDVTLKDDIPFMPEDLMSDGNLINSNEEHLTKPTMNELISNSLPKHLNEYQTADVIGLSVKTIRRMRHDMRGPNYIKLGRRVVYSETDLGLWLTNHRVETDS